MIDQAKASVVRCLSPAQRARYYLPQMQPRWCGGEGKYPYDSVSALIEGRRLLVGGKVDEASALFKEQLGRSSGSAVNDAWAKAYIELGRNHLRAQRNPDAEAMFAEALKRDPSSNGRIDAEWVDAFIARGSTLLRERKDDEASRTFADAIKRDPSASTRIEAEWATAFFVRGKDLLVEGKVDEAKSVFAEALKRDPSAASRINTAWVAAYVALGSKLVREAKNDEADVVFAEALRQDPSREARHPYQMGECLHRARPGVAASSQ